MVKAQLIDATKGLTPEQLQELGSALRDGALVVFPTETVYGIGADGMSSRAVQRIFQAKGRPQDNPVILHIAHPAMVPLVAKELPPVGDALIKKFWPGPLTLVLAKNDAVPAEVSAGLGTVALRMPDHPVALAIIQAAGVPLAAPSANTSGKPSPTDAFHAAQDLSEEVEYIVDGGPCRVGVESTVVDLTVYPPVILRHGAVTAEMLEEYGVVTPSAKELKALQHRSPGMRHRHYAPQGESWLFCLPEASLPGAIAQTAKDYLQQGKRVALLVTSDTKALLPEFTEVVLVFELGSRQDPRTIAANIFRCLRQCDQLSAEIILIEGITEAGLGKAISDRLRRACQGRVIDKE